MSKFLRKLTRAPLKDKDYLAETISTLKDLKRNSINKYDLIFALFSLYIKAIQETNLNLPLLMENLEPIKDNSFNPDDLIDLLEKVHNDPTEARIMLAIKQITNSDPLKYRTIDQDLYVMLYIMILKDEYGSSFITLWQNLPFYYYGIKIADTFSSSIERIVEIIYIGVLTNHYSPCVNDVFMSKYNGAIDTDQQMNELTQEELFNLIGYLNSNYSIFDNMSDINKLIAVGMVSRDINKNIAEIINIYLCDLADEPMYKIIDFVTRDSGKMFDLYDLLTVIVILYLKGNSDCIVLDKAIDDLLHYKNKSLNLDRDMLLKDLSPEELKEWIGYINTKVNMPIRDKTRLQEDVIYSITRGYLSLYGVENIGLLETPLTTIIDRLEQDMDDEDRAEIVKSIMAASLISYFKLTKENK